MIDKKGFSLIEVLSSVFIFSIIIAMVFGILAVGRESYYTGSTSIDLQDELRRGMSQVIGELYETNSARLTVTGSAGNHTLTFQVPTVDYGGTGSIYDSNGNINWGDGEGSAGSPVDNHLQYNIQYALSGNQLVRQTLTSTGSAVTNRVVARDITSFDFDTVNNVLTLTAQRNTVTGRSIQASLSSRVSFRN